MGYSMGGYMTYRMGLLMPDRFASATPYVGPPAYQLWAPPADPQPPGDYQVAGHTNRIVYNGLDLPFEINNGGVDELVPAAGAQRAGADVPRRRATRTCSTSIPPRTTSR